MLIVARAISIATLYFPTEFYYMRNCSTVIIFDSPTQKRCYTCTYMHKVVMKMVGIS